MPNAHKDFEYCLINYYKEDCVFLNKPSGKKLLMIDDCDCHCHMTVTVTVAVS